MTTAHDVRRLVLCAGCHELGDKRNLIPTDTAWYHGRCYLTEFGEDRFYALPRSHTGGLTLDDIGPDVMRKLLGKRGSAK